MHDRVYDIKISCFIMYYLFHHIGFEIILTKFRFIVTMANDIEVLDGNNLLLNFQMHDFSIDMLCDNVFIFEQNFCFS